MRRIYVVVELKDSSSFDPADDTHLDHLAEDLLTITHGVESATVFAAFSDLQADEALS